MQTTHAFRTELFGVGLPGGVKSQSTGDVGPIAGSERLFLASFQREDELVIFMGVLGNVKPRGVGTLR